MFEVEDLIYEAIENQIELDDAIIFYVKKHLPTDFVSEEVIRDILYSSVLDGEAGPFEVPAGATIH